jgi:hypothetical protein
MSVGRDVPWRVSTGEQAAKAKSNNPKMTCFAFMGANVEKNVEIFVQKKCFNPLHGFQIFGNLAV